MRRRGTGGTRCSKPASQVERREAQRPGGKPHHLAVKARAPREQVSPACSLACERALTRSVLRGLTSPWRLPALHRLCFRAKRGNRDKGAPGVRNRTGPAERWLFEAEATTEPMKAWTRRYTADVQHAPSLLREAGEGGRALREAGWGLNARIKPHPALRIASLARSHPALSGEGWSQLQSLGSNKRISKRLPPQIV